MFGSAGIAYRRIPLQPRHNLRLLTSIDSSMVANSSINIWLTCYRDSRRYLLLFLAMLLVPLRLKLGDRHEEIRVNVVLFRCGLRVRPSFPARTPPSAPRGTGPVAVAFCSGRCSTLTSPVRRSRGEGGVPRCG